MFQDFAKRKQNDYLGLLEFPDDKIIYRQIVNSPLPQYIISFFDHYLTDKNIPIQRAEFEDLLQKALVFNINYVIRPKYSIMRFLFGDVETRPIEFILTKLKYFQFYGYYISHISDFISINSLEVISNEHISRVIDEVNKKILEEINAGQGANSHRLNLVKLLYYFFIDLGDNNPINIKLPKKILSAFFADKGFTEIKTRVDNFFSEEVFIQEAVELMTPLANKPARRKAEVDVSEEQVKEIISKAKSRLISREGSKKEIEKILKSHEQIIDTEFNQGRNDARENLHEDEEQKADKPAGEENKYSGDLIFETQIGEIPPAVIVTEDLKKDNIINDLFCEATFRKKIIKKLFSKEEGRFRSFIGSVLEQNNWNDAISKVEDYFNKKKINYYSEEAVKFVDILHSYFTAEGRVKNYKAV